MPRRIAYVGNDERQLVSTRRKPARKSRYERYEAARSSAAEICGV